MININDVYQKVLAITNKEQRGYLTPQEFNLFANQAQMEIFEQYFYDLNQRLYVAGNDTPYADVDKMLEEKIRIFESFDPQNVVSSYVSGTQIPGSVNSKILPDYIYRINYIVGGNNKNCEILSTKDFENIRRGGYLTWPTADRPVVNIRNNELRILWRKGSIGTSAIRGIHYFRAPQLVSWGYVVVSGTAMYNPSNSVNCELHRSDETEMVHKILKYAGISMKREDLMRAGQGMELSQVEQEKQ